MTLKEKVNELVALKCGLLRTSSAKNMVSSLDGIKRLEDDIKSVSDSLPKLPVGSRVLVDGVSKGKIVGLAYVIEWDDRPSDFSTLTEDDGVELIEETA
jgi:hypothetical protein